MRSFEEQFFFQFVAALAFDELDSEAAFKVTDHTAHNVPDGKDGAGARRGQ